MSTIKKLTHGEYEIEVHPQPKTGDNSKVFIGVWKDNNKIFSVWEQISGTEARSIDETKVAELIEKKGIERAKQMIDNSTFKTGEEYRYWESAS